MVLTIIHRRPITKHEPMSAGDDEVLREGLGYFAAPELRPKAIDLVNIYRADEKWVGCDCRPDERFMPELWPVADLGFRRNLQDGKVHHSDECDFNQEPYPAKTVRASFQRKERANNILKFNLARGFRELESEAPNRQKVERINRSTPRPGLARLLCELLTEAGVQEIGIQDHFAIKPRYDEMVGKIEDAAKRIEIAPGHLLNKWISVGLDDFPSLKKRISKESADNWGGSRPHGILLCNFEELRERQLLFKADRLFPLPVFGRIAVFGEREAKKREPYLAICLIGKRDATASYPEVLRVYAHPCFSWAKWTLVDSNIERETIKRAQSCRYHLSKEEIDLKLQKPLFDLNPEKSGDIEPVCIPDFLINILSKPTAETIVVETMGYTDDRYRNRKRRLREYFMKIGQSETGKKAQIIYHDPTVLRDQEESHRAFWEELRDSVRLISS